MFLTGLSVVGYGSGVGVSDESIFRASYSRWLACMSCSRCSLVSNASSTERIHARTDSVSIASVASRGLLNRKLCACGTIKGSDWNREYKAVTFFRRPLRVLLRWNCCAWPCTTELRYFQMRLLKSQSWFMSWFIHLSAILMSCCWDRCCLAVWLARKASFQSELRCPWITGSQPSSVCCTNALCMASKDGNLEPSRGELHGRIVVYCMIPSNIVFNNSGGVLRWREDCSWVRDSCLLSRAVGWEQQNTWEKDSGCSWQMGQRGDSS